MTILGRRDSQGLHGLNLSHLTSVMILKPCMLHIMRNTHELRSQKSTKVMTDVLRRETAHGQKSSSDVVISRDPNLIKATKERVRGGHM